LEAIDENLKKKLGK